MKLKLKLPGAQVPKAVVRHTQTLRQTFDYQSAEASYSVELQVEPTTAGIQKGFRRAEELVEKALADKAHEQRTLLRALPPSKP